MTIKVVKADIKAARAAGADVVIVYPALGRRVPRDRRSWPSRSSLARSSMPAPT